MSILKAIAGTAVIAALFFGAGTIVKGNSDASTASTPSAPQNGAMPQASGAGQAPPGMGTTVTGATLTKLSEVATAKYPGTVEGAMKLADGSYVVHVISSDGSGELHVLVSSSFEVTGTETGPPAGMAPPSGQAPATSGSSNS